MNRDIYLRVEGSLLERLLQRALRRGACFARVRRTGPRTLMVAADARNAEILLDLCKKYGLDCRVLRRGGWAALGDLIRARWTLAPGIALCALACVLCLSRIWMVDVCFTGPCAELGNRSEILRCLEELGVEAGVLASRVDTDFLQKQLTADAGDYSFIGVRRQGIRLLVEASPEVPAPELYVIGRARDLVAARDGVIESITVHSGEACVKAGDTVRAGQLLIRGEEDKSKEETTPVGALGEVVARCWYEGRAEGSLKRTVLQPTGNSAIGCRLKLMKLSLTLTACDGFPSETRAVEILPVGGLFLPLEIERTVHSETVEVRQDVDAEALEAQLTALARADALRKIAADAIEYEVASEWMEASRSGNTLCVRAVYEIYTDIAVTRDALIEEVY